MGVLGANYCLNYKQKQNQMRSQQFTLKSEIEEGESIDQLITDDNI